MAYDATVKPQANGRKNKDKRQQQKQQPQTTAANFFNLIKYLKHRHGHHTDN